MIENRTIYCNHRWFVGQHWNSPPSLVVGCCPLNYCCPLCDYGGRSFPHDTCQGWPEYDGPSMVFKQDVHIRG